MEGMPTFAENLKKLMKERSISARVLSQATGVPTSTISEWTAGREPKLSDPIIKVARFFGVSLEHLATGQEPETRIIQDLFGNQEDSFFEIHQGIYKVRVEKLTKKPGGKP